MMASVWNRQFSLTAEKPKCPRFDKPKKTKKKKASKSKSKDKTKKLKEKKIQMHLEEIKQGIFKTKTESQKEAEKADAKLAELRTEATTLEKEILYLKEYVNSKPLVDIQSLKSQLEAIQIHSQTLEQSVATISDFVQSSKNQIEEANATLESENQKSLKGKQTEDALKEELESLESQLLKVNSKTESSNEEQKPREADISKEVEWEKQRCREMDQKWQDMDKAREDIRAKLNYFKVSLQEIDGNRRQMDRTLLNEDVRIEELKSSIRKKTKLADELSRQKEDWNSKCSKAVERGSCSEDDTMQLHEAISQLRSDMQHMNLELGQSGSIITKIWKKIDEERAARDHLRAQQAKLKKKAEGLCKIRSDIISELKIMKNALAI